ncbi:MAG: hypothetical protein GX966_09765 [Jeotgalicoccus halophilus]|nr:hypothetical protein [Jeotgalicoccus aerolatus]
MQDEKRKAVLHVLPTPFAIFQREKFDVVLMEDETVEQLARRICPKVKFNHFSIRTRHVKPDAVVKDGDEVIAWAVPEDPATIGSAIIQGAAYVYNAIVAASPYILGTMQFAAFGYSIYSYVQTRKLAKGAKKSSYGKEVDDASDTNYGWDFDASNPVTEGSPLPVIYGKRQVIPPIIQQRSTITNLSNKEFLEVIVGVAQGGAGFADTITFPADEHGDVDILLNHASWKNYISKTQFSDDSSENINRINSGISVLNGVYYENGTLTQYGGAYDLSNLCDGDTSTRAGGLAESQKYDSRNSPGFSGTKGNKYTRNFILFLEIPVKLKKFVFLSAGRRLRSTFMLVILQT